MSTHIACIRKVTMDGPRLARQVDIDTHTRSTINPERENLRHIVITGRGGSGKTSVAQTITDAVQRECGFVTDSTKQPRAIHSMEVAHVTFNEARVSPMYRDKQIALAHFDSRSSLATSIETDPTSRLYTTMPHRRYGPYEDACHDLMRWLHALKAQQAFWTLDRAWDAVKRIDDLFDRIRDVIRLALENPTATIDFDRTSCQFSIGRRDMPATDLKHLPDGASRMLHIVLGTMLRTLGTMSLTPQLDMAGIIVIDDIESHLDVEMQKRVLGHLAELFPNMQLIVTTSSPFVVEGATNAVVYDIDTGSIRDIDNLRNKKCLSYDTEIIG